MKQTPITPADVDFSDAHAPRSPLFDDRYNAPYGAFEQAAHVFLAGNRLPERWHDRASFTILETGFGLGNNFIATWAAWRADPRRPARLRFISIEKHPLRTPDLRRALQGCREPALADALCAAWPPLTPDFHAMSFDDDRVELLLVLGDAAARLRELAASVDAFFLDGFAPARNPQMWAPGLFKSMSRLSAPGATAATWSAARAVRDGLGQAGFAWRAAPGIGGKLHITLADFAPRITMRKPEFRVGDAGVRRVAIIGGGLAGAACAQALAREGVRCIVLDRHPEPAHEASGNAGGLFHGVFHPDDGMHARAHRAAALQAQSACTRAIAAGVAGRCDGLVRLTPEHVDAQPLLEDLATAGLPPDYLQAWSPQQVQAAGGPACAAWFYPGGGWISPPELVRHWLARPGIEWHGSTTVARLSQAGDAGAVARPWQLFDEADRLIVEADAVVFANAGEAATSWSHAADAAGGRGVIDAAWLPALLRTRGQVSLLAADTPGLRPPTLPIAGAGYALTLAGGDVMCGATTSPDDSDPTVRLADHLHNLRQLAAVTGGAPAADDTAFEAEVAALVEQGRLHGRVGWRATAVDRLPLVGALPMQPAGDPAAQPDQPRHWARVPGLFACTGFGSRGLTWAPLAGRLIAAWILDTPFPVPTDLVDALDPARFAARRVRTLRRPPQE